MSEISQAQIIVWFVPVILLGRGAALPGGGGIGARWTISLSAGSVIAARWGRS